MSASAVYDTSRRYVEGGLSVIPVRVDGSKQPVVSEWRTYQQRRPTPEELRKWFKGTATGIAIIGGVVSGNLTRLDFDEGSAYDDWLKQCEECDLGSVVAECPLVETPRGGRHLYMRSDAPVAGNEKLCYRLLPLGTGARIENAGKSALAYVPGHEKGLPVVESGGTARALFCAIETRGEGGYVLAPPSPPHCHPLNKPYRLLSGDLCRIPVLSSAYVSAMIAIARSMTEYIEPERVYRQPAISAPTAGRPGDEYNARGDYESLLERHGWTRSGARGETQHWSRPGKSKGISATSGFADRMFYVFSTNAHPFEAERGYAPFSVYALLEHGGDFQAAARQLSSEGFGERPSVRIAGELASTAPPGPGRTISIAEPAFPVADPVAEIEAGMVDADAGEGEGKNGPSDLTLATLWSRSVLEEWRYCEGDQWWQYVAGRWRYRGVEFVQRAVQDWLIRRRLQTRGRDRNQVRPVTVRNVMMLAASMLGPHEISEFNPNALQVPLTNGVYDIRTRTLLPHSPANLITNQLDFAYDAGAVCPRWQQFIRETMLALDGEFCAEWAGALQEWYGYCMIPDNRAQISMFWVGEGANGKGVATRILESLVGHAACTAIPIEQLHDPYHRADIYGKLVGLVNEPDRRAMQKNGNWFKYITGGEDIISARRPGEKVFTFKSLCRVVVSCNHLPSTNDPSRAYFRRIKAIEWRFNCSEAQRDTALDDTLRAELPGIFNWALVGLDRFVARGYRLEDLPESNRLLNEYRLTEDTVARFADEELEFARGVETPSKTLYDRYCSWCRDNNVERIESSEKFFKHLARRGCAVIRRRVDDRPHPIRFWQGVKTTC